MGLEVPAIDVHVANLRWPAGWFLALGCER
jgi:hypothetical protein